MTDAKKKTVKKITKKKFKLKRKNPTREIEKDFFEVAENKVKELIKKKEIIDSRTIPNARDLKIASQIILGDENGRKSKKEILKEAGYSKTTQNSPSKYFDSTKAQNAVKTIKETAKELGLTDDFLLGEIKKDIIDKREVPASQRARMREIELASKIIGVGNLNNPEEKGRGNLNLVNVNIDKLEGKDLKDLLEGKFTP